MKLTDDQTRRLALHLWTQTADGHPPTVGIAERVRTWLEGEEEQPEDWRVVILRGYAKTVRAHTIELPPWLHSALNRLDPLSESAQRDLRNFFADVIEKGLEQL